jgi:regulator of replication initiation timing
MNASGENQLLLAIQNSLMTLLGEVGAVKQSIEHLVTNHDRLRNELTKLDDRVTKVERAQIASNSSWKGPQAFMGVAGGIVALIMGILVLLDKT